MRKGSKKLKNENVRRLVAGASTAAMAAGFAASFGVGTASAFSVQETTTSGSWTINRTIQNVPTSAGANPLIGSRIKVSAQLQETSWKVVLSSAIKDVHDPCLTYVPGTAKVNGGNPGVEPAADSVRMTGTWGEAPSYEVQYDITPNCATDVNMLSSVHISSNQSTGTSPANVGPTFKISKLASTTGLAVAPAPQSDAVSTLTATVPAGATGDVEFANNGTVLGNGTIANGTATYAWTPSAADAGQTFSITAKYLGDATHAESTSTPQTGTVTAAPTAPAAPTDLAVNPASVTVGTAVTVSGKAEANSTVKVTAGDKTCDATADATGAFSCDIVTDAAGTLTVTAVATNAVGTGPASSPVTIDVTKHASTTGLAVAPAPQSDAVSTLTATVPAGATGDVEFANNGTVLGNGTIANGTATYAWTPSAADAGQTFSITAKYLGDATHAESTSTPQTGTVNAAPTAPAAPTDVVATPATVTAGDTVTVSGKAEANSAVKVTAGDKTCDATADATGAFSCDIVTDAAGTLTVTAVATNAVGAGPASNPVTVTVNAAPTAPAAPTDVVATPATVTAGDTVTVSGKAEANSAVKVTAGDKTCDATADATGAFSCDIVTDAAGTLTVTAVATNAVGAGPASNPATVTVNAAPVGTAVISVDPAAPTAGTRATVTVTGADAGTEVTVKNGAETICTAPVSADGTATCAWTPTAGSQTLTAEVVVNGTATTVTKVVTVAAEETPGGGNAAGGSLAGLFGSS